MAMFYAKKVILLVDDDDDDLLFAKKAIESNLGVNNVDIRSVKDGEQLLDYLNQKGQYENAPMPSIIFLDIKMPRLNGLKALESIKNNEKLRYIPIIILTSSEVDIDDSYNKGANSYIVKPITQKDFENIMDKMKKFWFETARLPRELRG